MVGRRDDFSMSAEHYAQFFERITGNTPYAYQGTVAANLIAGANVLVRAPTGAGKTRAVLLPFFFRHLRGLGPRRLIYALPLRMLVESISREARALADACGPVLA